MLVLFGLAYVQNIVTFFKVRCSSVVSTSGRLAVRWARVRIPTRHPRVVSATELFSDDDKWRMSVDATMYEKNNKVKKSGTRPTNLYILYWFSFPYSCFLFLLERQRGRGIQWPHPFRFIASKSGNSQSHLKKNKHKTL
jgi:hypothetical protein